MGTWSTSLSSNDLYADIYYEFFDLYNDGYDIPEISEKLCAENQEIFEDPEDGHNFWFALAKAQWECQALDPTIYDRVKKIIESGIDIEVWRELDASEADIKKRQMVLDNFLETLSSPRPKKRARKRKSYKIHDPVYQKGDCLTFTFSNGWYGGVIVLEEISGTADEGSYNLIAPTNIFSPSKPTMKDFKKSHIIFWRHESYDEEKEEIIWVESPQLLWCGSRRTKDKEDITELIGNLKVKKIYTVNDDSLQAMHTGTFNMYDVEAIEYTLNVKDIKSKPVKIKKYTGSFF